MELVKGPFNGTVKSFDPGQGIGVIVLDDGREATFFVSIETVCTQVKPGDKVSIAALTKQYRNIRTLEERAMGVQPLKRRIV